MASPSKEITNEGSPVLRLAFYQAANVARSHDPKLADFYRGAHGRAWSLPHQGQLRGGAQARGPYLGKDRQWHQLRAA
jgi:hypothetical protein